MSQTDVLEKNGLSPKMSRGRGQSFVSLDIDHSLEDTRELRGEEQMDRFEKIQFYILRVVEHIAVQIFSVVLILVDVGITIASIASEDEVFDRNTRIASNVFLGYFVMEISLRFIAIGGRKFVRNIWEMLDVLIIGTSVVVAFSIKGEGGEFSRLSVAARGFRMVRLVRLIPQCRRCVLSMRLTTSENKRRYREEGFDLDLTYITENVIAMSFPSSGWLALYRNPIEDVVKFFNKRHKNHYKIYNLCSEREYEVKLFDYNVRRFMIDDHNVPTLDQMMDFVTDAGGFLKRSTDNVIAVHCKGGKGRTGSMICVYLLYAAKADYPTGEKAREHFATRRSDFRVSKKFQGVQTPSQCRFIDYFEQIIYNFDSVIPEAPSLFVKSLIVHHPPAAIQSPTSDLLVEVCTRETPLISFTLLSAKTVCDVTYAEDNLTIEFHDHIKPCVTGDIKIRFKSDKLPIKYDKASFYFWFNTIFIRNSELYIEREMLDNPHFTQYNKVYGQDFGVTVRFDRKQQQRLV